MNSPSVAVFCEELDNSIFYTFVILTNFNREQLKFLLKAILKAIGDIPCFDQAYL